MIGAILPLTGPDYLARFGNQILSGIRLALPGGGEGDAPIRLVVVDDHGSDGSAPDLVRRLTGEGALVVIGPLSPEGLRAAAAARPDPALSLVSPTAGVPPANAPNVYTLNGPDRAGPAALAAWVAASGLGDVAVLHSTASEYAAQARAFAAALRQAGGRVSLEVPFDSGATSFGPWMKRVVSASPSVLYVPASEADVRQLAPQLRYFGMNTDSVTVLGSEEWTSPASLRTIRDAGLRDVVAVTPMLRNGETSGWSEFVARYEEAERRSLDTPYPALGYDAALLAARALGARASAGMARTPEEAARRLASLRDVAGATARFDVVDGTLERRPVVVRVVDGRLVAVDGAPQQGDPEGGVR